RGGRADAVERPGGRGGRADRGGAGDRQHRGAKARRAVPAGSGSARNPPRTWLRDTRSSGFARWRLRPGARDARVCGLAVEEGGAVRTRNVRQVVMNAVAVVAVLGVVFGAVSACGSSEQAPEAPPAAPGDTAGG